MKSKLLITVCLMLSGCTTFKSSVGPFRWVDSRCINSEGFYDTNIGGDDFDCANAIVIPVYTVGDCEDWLGACDADGEYYYSDMPIACYDYVHKN